MFLKCLDLVPHPVIYYYIARNFIVNVLSLPFYEEN